MDDANQSTQPRIDALNEFTKTGTLSFDTWSATGLFTKIQDYYSDYGMKTMFIDCYDVVVYFGGHVIGVTKEGKFYVPKIGAFDKLANAEHAIWISEVNGYYNNNII